MSRRDIADYLGLTTRPPHAQCRAFAQ
ncbi:hypothetical protein [Bradyrhizobium sp. CCBAU 11430]|nr:hypothetical protein [Bradyrhizobium sp. CCBAU 11430]